MESLFHATVLDDGPGWDDGSPHAGGVSRMPKKLIVVITIVTLIVAVVSIGLVVAESNMSVHRHQLASACETAVAEMGQARERGWSGGRTVQDHRPAGVEQAAETRIRIIAEGCQARVHRL